MHAWDGQDKYRRKLQGGKIENWKENEFGWGEVGAVTRVERIMVSD